jgi:hypothetical protein
MLPEGAIEAGDRVKTRGESNIGKTLVWVGHSRLALFDAHARQVFSKGHSRYVSEAFAEMIGAVMDVARDTSQRNALRCVLRNEFLRADEPGGIVFAIDGDMPSGELG